MGVLHRLSRLFARKQPDRSQTWTRDPGLVVECDLSLPSFCGVRFGEPYWRDADADEVLLFYELPEVEWQLEFPLPAATLSAMVIVTPPLLADRQQRHHYGLDKPWPPPPPHLRVR
jgi:hypothetical protein